MGTSTSTSENGSKRTSGACMLQCTLVEQQTAGGTKRHKTKKTCNKKDKRHTAKRQKTYNNCAQRASLALQINQHNEGLRNKKQQENLPRRRVKQQRGMGERRKGRDVKVGPTKASSRLAPSVSGSSPNVLSAQGNSKTISICPRNQTGEGLESSTEANQPQIESQPQRTMGQGTLFHRKTNSRSKRCHFSCCQLQRALRRPKLPVRSLKTPQKLNLQGASRIYSSST